MPGVNVIGRCNAPIDSSKKLTSLAIAIEIQGETFLDIAYSGGPYSVDTLRLVFSSKVEKVFERKPYKHSGEPDEDEFWLFQEKCCCPCRVGIKPPNPSIYEPDVVQFPGPIDWDLREDRDGTITESGGSDSDNYFYFRLISTGDEMKCRDESDPREHVECEMGVGLVSVSAGPVFYGILSRCGRINLLRILGKTGIAEFNGGGGQSGTQTNTIDGGPSGDWGGISGSGGLPGFGVEPFTVFTCGSKDEAMHMNATIEWEGSGSGADLGDIRPEMSGTILMRANISVVFGFGASGNSDSDGDGLTTGGLTTGGLTTGGLTTGGLITGGLVIGSIAGRPLQPSGGLAEQSLMITGLGEVGLEPSGPL